MWFAVESIPIYGKYTMNLWQVTHTHTYIYIYIWQIYSKSHKSFVYACVHTYCVLIIMFIIIIFIIIMLFIVTNVIYFRYIRCRPNLSSRQTQIYDK